MVQTPESLIKFLSNFKKNNFFTIGLIANKKNNGKNLVFMKIFSYLYLIFHFHIWKLFVHILWSSIGTLTIDEIETNISIYIPIWSNGRQCMALCVHTRLARGGRKILASCLAVAWLSQWTKKWRNHTAFFTPSCHSTTPGELAFQSNWLWGCRAEGQRETGCLVT